MINELENAVNNLKVEVEKLENLVDDLDQEFDRAESEQADADRVLSDAKESLIRVTKQAKLDRDNK